MQLENILEAVGENKKLPGTSRTETQQAEECLRCFENRLEHLPKLKIMKTPKPEATVSHCGLAAQKCRSLMTVSDFHTNL